MQLRASAAVVGVGLLLSVIAGAAYPHSRGFEPFRSTASGDLYRIPDPAHVVKVELLGYRYHSLDIVSLRRDVRRGVLALSLQGRPVGIRYVAAAPMRPIRRRHRLVLTMASRNTTTSPPPTAPAGSSSSCPVPYAGSSAWNTPISSKAKLDPNSASMIATLTTNTSYPMLGSDPTQYTMPVYQVDSTTPVLLVSVAGSWSDVTGGTTLHRSSGGTEVRVPIPLVAQGASGGDAQVVVVNRSTGDEWGFWEFSNVNGSMRATNGYHYNTAWSGVPPAGFASRGAGVPYLAGLVRPCEIAQGQIDHALAFAYQNNGSSFMYPATKSDGATGGVMPEGTHLQLDPSISDSVIHGWGCTGACFTTAKALQRYGMYDIDNSGHPKVYFEDHSTANWGSTVTASTVNPIPLADFRVVDR